MRIQETKVYKIEELTKEVQEKVIENNHDINVGYNTWHEYIIEMWQEKLEAVGFEDMNIYFSGFSSQGDGACFEGGNIDNEKVLNSILCDSPEFIKVLNITDYFDLSLYRNNNNYNHENCHSISLDVDYSCIQNDKVVDFLDSFSSAVDELRENLCQQIYSSLEKEYNYLTTNEAIQEGITSNEIEFTIDGKSF